MVETTLKMVSYIINQSKIGPNYRKGGKNFQKFEKFLQIVKNSKHYITFEIFTRLSSELQQRIPGDPTDGIHYCFFQVLTHALLIHFDANFVKSHGVFGILRQSKIRAPAHTEIKGFSTYRVGYTQKMPPNSHTYIVVQQTVMYGVALNVF